MFKLRKEITCDNIVLNVVLTGVKGVRSVNITNVVNLFFSFPRYDQRTKYNTLWRRCRQASASINEVCDMYGSRNSGTGTSTVLAWVSYHVI